jgi:hypothetical protein
LLAFVIKLAILLEIVTCYFASSLASSLAMMIASSLAILLEMGVVIFHAFLSLFTQSVSVTFTLS